MKTKLPRTAEENLNAKAPRRKDARQSHSFPAPLRLCVFALILLPLCLPAATNDLSGALQKGLFEEEANRNLDAAIQAYQSVAARFDKDRQLAATAIFRLGECYRKLGKTNEAAVQYERIVREFSDQNTLVTLSRQNLVGLGATPTQTPSGSARQQNDAQAEAASLLAQIKELKGLSPSMRRIAIQQSFPNPVLSSLMQDLSRAEQNVVGVRNDYGPDNPEVKKATAVLDTINKQIDTQLEGAMAGLEIKAAAALQAAQTSPQKSDKGWEYLVKAGETLSLIVQTYREQGIKVTADQILKANPKLDPTKLRVGQKIWIPDPGEIMRPEDGNGLASTDDEEKEIRRIQTMVKDSPDLINAKDVQAGATPLHYAAGNGQLRVAEFLLANGANTEAKDRNWSGQTTLHYAASSGHKTMVELLLSKKAEVQSVDDNGKTPLHLAALKGNKSVIEVLMAHGADVNAKTKAGGTALHIATANSFKSVAELLLSRGADVNANTSSEILTLSNERFNGTPLHIAAKRGDQAMAEWLLTNKANVNAQTDSGGTPLLAALQNGHATLVEILLAKGADVNTSDKSGTTPLLVAVANGLTDAARLLLKHKANPDVPGSVSVDAGRSYSYNYPLRVAIEKGNIEILKVLLENGANPNFESTEAGKYREAALFAAIGKKQNDAVELLLKFKADPNRVDSDGFSPLMRAIGDKNKEIVALLVNGGADVNLAERRGGSTALAWAVGNQDKEITALLLAQGADPNKQDAYGQTPLDRAKSQNSPKPSLSAEIAGLLRQHGALDDLPDFKAIRITRQGVVTPFKVFSANTNGWNRFTLLETILSFYSQQHVRIDNNSMTPPSSALPYPNLSRIIIHRPSTARGEKEAELEVNLLNSTNRVVCTADVPLKFGDVIEIPIREHSLLEPAVGLSQPELNDIAGCLARQVKLVVRGQEHELRLWGATQLSAALQRSEAQSRLLSTSDLSRVKMTRKDPAAQKPQEFTVDARKNPSPSDDLWLRDGDVIEVPDKP